MAILRIILIVAFVLAALAVTIIVLLQEGKSAGLGSLSGAGGNNDSYWDKNRKHSLEGKFERWTKIIAGVFVVSALVLMLMPTGSKTSTNNGVEGTTNTIGTTDGATTDAATDTQTESTDGATEGTSTEQADGAAAESTTESTATPEASEAPAQ